MDIVGACLILWYLAVVIWFVGLLGALTWLIERVPAARRAIDRMIERLERE